MLLARYLFLYALESSLDSCGEISISRRNMDTSSNALCLLSRVVSIVIDRDGRGLEFRLGYAR